MKERAQMDDEQAQFFVQHLRDSFTRLEVHPVVYTYNNDDMMLFYVE